MVVIWDRKRRDNSLGIIANSMIGLEYPLYVAKIYYFMLYLNASLLIFELEINHIVTLDSERHIFRDCNLDMVLPCQPILFQPLISYYVPFPV